MHNELLPVQLLIRLAQSEGSTPFPIMEEVFALHLAFEIIREAGLRMPRPISNSVSFIATLLIGEAAVNAGIISLPAVMLVAITGICSFTSMTLYQPLAILRLALILIGGTTGIIGIAVFSAGLLVHICSLHTGKIPLTAPISPLRLKSLRDFAARANWKILGSKTVNVNKMPGTDNNG